MKNQTIHYLITDRKGNYWCAHTRSMRNQARLGTLYNSRTRAVESGQRAMEYRKEIPALYLQEVELILHED